MSDASKIHECWHRQPLVIILMACAAGIIADKYVSLPIAGTLLAGGIVIAAWWIAHSKKRDRLAAWLLLAACANGAAAYHHAAWNLYPADEISRWGSERNRAAAVRVVVRGTPEVFPAPEPDPMSRMSEEEQTRIAVDVRSLRDGREWIDVSGRATLLVNGRMDSVGPGDVMRVFGFLRIARPPLNPGEFPTAEYARSHRQMTRILATSPEAIRVESRGSPFHWRRLLHGVRIYAIRVLREHIPPGQAELAMAILLGTRSEVDRHREEDFLLTGTVHLLCISGIHVGILAYGIWLVASFVVPSRRNGLVITMLATIVFAMLTGGRPPVMRATLLVCTACTAKILGRIPVSLNALALAGLVVLMCNPATLFHAGTQLSFLAVATLIVAGRTLLAEVPLDPLDRLIAESRPWPIRRLRAAGRVIRAFFMATLAVWIVALPLVWYHFRLVSPIAIVLNPFLWLPVGIALYAGFLVLTVGGFVPFVGDLGGYVCACSLRLIEGVIGWAVEIDASHFWLPPPPWWWVALTYAGLIVGNGIGASRIRKRWLVVVIAAWLVVGLMTATRAWEGSTRDRLACNFVAVGHGLGTFLELPNGQVLVYDAGRLGSPDFGGETIAGVLWSRGITRIDSIVISHADADHYNAIPTLLRRFQIGTIFVSPVVLHDATPGAIELFRQIEHHNVATKVIQTGDHLDAGKSTTIRVLHPPSSGVPGGKNANSIVLEVAYAGRKILLTGDLEDDGLDALIGREREKYDVLTAPHHGSRYSEPERIAAWGRPSHVIISRGISATDTTARRVYEQSGATVYDTPESGCVRIVIERDKMDVRTWRESPW